ncbi:MAG: ABC transporter substrate-binding protein [Lachnospiraceae bacterium]|nr:ABC transporter substrate-binding protein [Lachnospiraceae bacterium]
MRRKASKALAMALALTTTLGSFCGMTSVTALAEESYEVVTLARDLDSNNLDPVMTADNCDIWVLNMMVEGLVGTSDDGQEIIPAVADTWEVSDDGLVYTFHLRDGIKFSNGDDVTIEDCIYSIDRAKNADGPWIGMLDMIETIEDGGDNTIVITLNTVSPSFLSTLAMFSSGIMQKSYCEEVGEDGISACPMGTGPYVLTEWDRGEKMVFTKNEYYWEEGKPEVDEINMVIVADDNTRIMQLESGQIDIATQVPYSRIDELTAMDGINVELFDSTDVKFVLLNCQSEYLQDKRVRQALNLATDKAAINTAVYFGYGELAETFLSPSAPHYNENLETTEVDIEAAKALMEEAGYADGFPLTIEVGSGDTAYLQIATMLQAEWAEIGVTLSIQQIDTATARQNWKDGNYDVYISYMTSDMTDTSELAGLWCIEEQAHCWRTYWNDEDQAAAEELCKLANSEMDETLRMEYYCEMQEIVADAVPLIPLVYSPFTFVYSDRVSGATQSPLGIYNFKNLVVNE